MADGPIGITFRETMAGPFSLDETEPDDGKSHGRRAGLELAMHATVVIDDLDRFIADPHHLGGLSGKIDYPPFGSDVPSTSGVFNLFSPSGEPSLKLMVYELGFTHAGVDYYLAGKKEVRDDPGFDLWADTTTLFTLLHEGRDKSGAVAGAGILTLGVADLVRLVSTFRATGAKSTLAAADAVYKFGKFFLGELWDSYVHHTKTHD